MRGSSISALRYSSLVDELDERGALLPVVLPPEMAPAVIGPHLLEGAGDLVDVVGEQPRKGEESKRVEERELVIGESHDLFSGLLFFDLD